MIIPKSRIKWKPSGRVTQFFGENANPLYKNKGLKGHPGVDIKNGYGSYVRTHMPAHVYKVGECVSMLTNYDDKMYMEVKACHLDPTVEAGETIPEDWLIGTESNHGNVYSNGVFYSDKNPKKGIKGSHTHWQYRPVIKTDKIKKDRLYLSDINGERYWNDGYFELVSGYGDYRGCMNPYLWKYKNSATEKAKVFSQYLRYFYEKWKV